MEHLITSYVRFFSQTCTDAIQIDWALEYFRGYRCENM